MTSISLNTTANLEHEFSHFGFSMFLTEDLSELLFKRNEKGLGVETSFSETPYSAVVNEKKQCWRVLVGLSPTRLMASCQHFWDFVSINFLFKPNSRRWPWAWQYFSTSMHLSPFSGVCDTTFCLPFLLPSRPPFFLMQGKQGFPLVCKRYLK